MICLMRFVVTGAAIAAETVDQQPHLRETEGKWFGLAGERNVFDKFPRRSRRSGQVMADRADLVLIASATLDKTDPLPSETLARWHKLADGASSEVTHPQVQKGLQRLLRQLDESGLPNSMQRASYGVGRGAIGHLESFP